MHFSLQAGTAAGLQVTSPALTAIGQVLIASHDWSILDLDSQAVGIALGVQAETRPWLEDLASRQPVRAVGLALRASRYSLRFARVGSVIARVPEVARPTSAASLPSAEFWRELRRTIAEDPGTQSEVQAVAVEQAPGDVRLRAGLAYALPSAAWWGTADRTSALLVGDAETGALMLLALMRNDGGSLQHIDWPPPVYSLRGLDPDELTAAERWCPATSGFPISKSPQAVRAALQRIGRRESLALLSGIQPTRELVQRSRRPQARAGALQQLLRRVLADHWERESQRPGTLPPLQLPDGGWLADAPSLARLRGALRGRDAAALDDFRRRATAESLAAFAECLFVQWLLDDRPATGRWALEALGRFPSDAGADALAELAIEPEHSRDVAKVLARMGTRTGLTRLAMLSHTDAFEVRRVETTHLLEAAAEAQGLSISELEDRLFPSLTVPPGVTVRLDGELRVVLERDGAPLPLAPEWQAAAEVLPAAVRRLEQRMVDGPAMTALHFTETWAMNPLLFEVARRLVWGVFRGDLRIALLIPGQPAPVMPGDGLGLRPLHAVELAAEELRAVSLSLVDPQPFEQLTRQCFEPEWPSPGEVILEDVRELHRQLSRWGWTRDLAGRDIWERTGGGWQARIAFAGSARAFQLHYRLSEFSLQGAAPWRVVSELQREFFIAARQAQQADRRRDASSLVSRTSRCGERICVRL